MARPVETVADVVVSLLHLFDGACCELGPVPPVVHYWKAQVVLAAKLQQVIRLGFGPTVRLETLLVLALRVRTH